MYMYIYICICYVYICIHAHITSLRSEPPNKQKSWQKRCNSSLVKSISLPSWVTKKNLCWTKSWHQPVNNYGKLRYFISEYIYTSWKTVIFRRIFWMLIPLSVSTTKLRLLMVVHPNLGPGESSIRSQREKTPNSESFVFLLENFCLFSVSSQ